MSATPAPIRVLPDGTRAGSLGMVAEILGEHRTQVQRWADARERNGSPAPLPGKAAVTGHAAVDLYDVDEWRVWRMHYTPRRGVRHPRATPAAAPPPPPRSRRRRGGPGSPSAIARVLGVSTKQVCKWVDRRAANGCPQPGADGRHDPAAWLAWHAVYDPRGRSRRAAA